MSTTQLSAPSIILEWETVLDSGIARASASLREISRQLRDLHDRLTGEPELIVCFEPQDIGADSLNTILTDAAGSQGWAASVQLVPAPPGTSYYEKKNLGFRSAGNEIVLFFDTDLMPEKGWLRSVLAAFLDWRCAVVQGTTHLDTAGFYDRAVALFWIFDPAGGGDVRRSERLLSNNIAFRRSIFARFPFPDYPTYRGQCSQLLKQLTAAGIPVYEAPEARASHPPPPGWRGFVARAWAAGSDEHYYQMLESRASFQSNWEQLRIDLRRVAGRLALRRQALRPSFAGLCAGRLLGTVYYVVKALAYLAVMTRENQSRLSRPPFEFS